jgi:hypothetical protein
MWVQTMLRELRGKFNLTVNVIDRKLAKFVIFFLCGLTLISYSIVFSCNAKGL